MPLGSLSSELSVEGNAKAPNFGSPKTTNATAAIPLAAHATTETELARQSHTSVGHVPQVATLLLTILTINKKAPAASATKLVSSAQALDPPLVC